MRAAPTWRRGSVAALVGKADASALAALLSTVDGLDTPLEVDTKIAFRRSWAPSPTRRCWPRTRAGAPRWRRGQPRQARTCKNGGLAEAPGIVFLSPPFFRQLNRGSYEVKHNERARAQASWRLGAGPFSHPASASRSPTGGSAPSMHVSRSRLASDCEEGSPPPHTRLHSSSAQQPGNTARRGACEQAHKGHPLREPPATDLETEDK